MDPAFSAISLAHGPPTVDPTRWPIKILKWAYQSPVCVDQLIYHSFMSQKSHIWDVNYYLEKKYKKILQTIFWMNFYVDYKSNNHQFQTPTLLLCIDF